MGEEVTERMGADEVLLEQVLSQVARWPAAGLVEQVFAQCFLDSHRTLLCGGGDEPFYEASRSAEEPSRIIYRSDYASSALHEVAHWCIAGKRRRGLSDYGYWYSPDGRTAEQQLAFEKVEVAPQALESLFADAWGITFELSADNVAATDGASASFAEAVARERGRLMECALPARAARFEAALRRMRRDAVG